MICDSNQRTLPKNGSITREKGDAVAIFDYKKIGSEKSNALFRDVYDLIMYAQVLVDSPGRDWKQLSAKELNYAGVTDARGTFYGERAVVGTAQAEISGKYDTQGNFVSIGVTFLGTGGPLGLQDYLRDFVNNIQAAFNPKGFGTEYPYLAFSGLLSSVATYAQQHGLTGKDIIFAGGSLGGMAVNSMADLSDQRWDGFYKDSSYIAVVSPTQSATQKVLNVGAENDPVYRMMEDGKLTLGSLFTHDNLGSSTTDNIISFNDHYASFWHNLLPQSVLNPLSWLVHEPKEIGAYMLRIIDSKFYDLTHQDSTMVVSTLSKGSRETTWVENLGRYGATQSGPTFTLGTDSNDKLRGSGGTDYLEGGKGDDVFEDRGGYNIILGGQGYNSMNLQGSLSQFEVAYDSAKDGLNDGPNTLYIRDEKGAISILRDIATLNTQETTYYVGFIPWTHTVKREVTVDGLRTDSAMIAYEPSLNGNSSSNHLTATSKGDWLFGKGGDDILSSNKADVTFVGGSGNDVIISQGGGANIFLFDGNFGHDQIFDFHATDTLKFVGVHGVADNFDYRHFAAEVNNNTVLNFGDSSVTLVGVGLDSLSSSGVAIA